MENKQKQYNNTYYAKHKEEIHKCDICDGKYSVMNKSHHIRSKKHLKKLEEKENQPKNDMINDLIKRCLDLGKKIEIKDNIITIV